MYLKRNCFKNKGNISIVFIATIGLSLLIYAYVQYMNTNTITMKHENISQYTRDTLLILESTGEVDKDYLLDVKSKLSDKLNMKDLESLTMNVQVGNDFYNVTTMPNEITPNYGDTIEIEFVYKYIDKRISYTGEFLKPIVSNKIETMEVDLSTKSKNRRDSDG